MRAPASRAEISRAAMLRHAPGGFEEVERGDEIEFAVYTDREGVRRFRLSFARARSVLVEADWEDRWRSFHRPVRAGGIWIGPPWEQQPSEGVAVVIDPGLAFGTGAHPTTRACVELLVRQERGSVLDAGCGSGVVAVAAARLGFGPVVAVDVDPVAVEATRENALRNDVHIDARQLDALDDELPLADLVVANIELTAVEALLTRHSAQLAITSGYLARQVPVAPGWGLLDALELDGWAAHVLAAE